ncbi:MAG: protein-glutamate O-methyltransferase CheR, partial [Caldilineae bacterium]
MQIAISEPLLDGVSHLVREKLGLYYSERRRRELANGIARAARAFGFDDAEACARWLLDTPLTKSQLDTLAAHLTIGETYFFREHAALDVLRETILPPLLDPGHNPTRTLRIWSAGCCTGEEPYTIAILLDELLPNRDDWHISILATDVNPRFLEKATRAVYREWSFRRTPARIREKYFIREGKNAYRLVPRIQRMVTFSYLNLIEDAYPSLLNGTASLHLIFCRNVLMYFAPDVVQTVLSRFHRALVPEGWLIVSSVEVSYLVNSPFTPVRFSGATLYRK